jgi:hypothetical protein
LTGRQLLPFHLFPVALFVQQPPHQTLAVHLYTFLYTRALAHTRFDLLRVPRCPPPGTRLALSIRSAATARRSGHPPPYFVSALCQPLSESIHCGPSAAQRGAAANAHKRPVRSESQQAPSLAQRLRHSFIRLWEPPRRYCQLFRQAHRKKGHYVGRSPTPSTTDHTTSLSAHHQRRP